MNQCRMIAVVSAFLCFVVMSQTALAANQCMSKTEFRAERVRALQSALMFSALKCVHKPQLGLQDNYNEIMERFGKDLAKHSITVQQYFRRTQGPAHRRHLHKYVTGMANRYSIISFSEPNFCEGMSELGQSILDGADDAIAVARFNRRLLLPILAEPCEPEENAALLVLNRRVPDPVSIHMPEIDDRLRREAQAQRQY
jgi:hypothetical protein